MASLTSDSSKIDPPLDTLRDITARGPQHTMQLTAADETALIGVYRGIEHYLTSEEKLRIFKTEELRADIVQRFHLSASDTARLWN